MTSSLRFLQRIKIMPKHVLFLFFIPLQLCFLKLTIKKPVKIYPTSLNFDMAQEDVTIYIKV
jgi:hypothetical protein